MLFSRGILNISLLAFDGESQKGNLKNQCWCKKLALYNDKFVYNEWKLQMFVIACTVCFIAFSQCRWKNKGDEWNFNKIFYTCFAFFM